MAGDPDDFAAADQNRTQYPLNSGYFIVNEKIFQLLCPGHAQRGKPVSRLKVAHNQRKLKFIYIKKSNLLSSTTNIGNCLDIHFSEFDMSPGFLYIYSTGNVEGVFVADLIHMRYAAIA